MHSFFVSFLQLYSTGENQIHNGATPCEPYVLPVLYCKYHVRLSCKDISKRGIDPQSRIFRSKDQKS